MSMTIKKERVRQENNQMRKRQRRENNQMRRENNQRKTIR